MAREEWARCTAARDGRLNRDVAIKILPASFSSDPDRLPRFAQEARAAALSRPNILSIFDIDEDRGSPCVVFEHVVIYSKDPDADCAFFGEALKFSSVDVAFRGRDGEDQPAKYEGEQTGAAPVMAPIIRFSTN